MIVNAIVNITNIYKRSYISKRDNLQKTLYFATVKEDSGNLEYTINPQVANEYINKEDYLTTCEIALNIRQFPSGYSLQIDSIKKAFHKPIDIKKQ